MRWGEIPIGGRALVTDLRGPSSPWAGVVLERTPDRHDCQWPRGVVVGGIEVRVPSAGVRGWPPDMPVLTEWDESDIATIVLEGLP